MKHLFFATILCTLAINGWSQTWTKIGNMPIKARQATVGLAYNNKEYLVTGDLNYGVYTDSMWEYTPGTNMWRFVTLFPGGHRYGAAGFVIGNKAYVGLGIDDINYTPHNDFYSYDFAADTWTAVASFPGAARYDESTFVLGNKGYIIGGSVGGPPYLNDVFAYDPTANSWSSIASLPVSSASVPTTFPVNNIGYVAGGYVNPGCENEVLKLDTLSNTWVNMGILPDSGYEGQSVFNFNGQEYLVTGGTAIDGYSSYVRTNVVFIYDAVNNIWSRQSVFPGDTRDRAVGFNANGYGYIMAGRGDNGYYNDIWQYAPVTNGCLATSSDTSVSICTSGLPFVWKGHNYTATGTDTVLFTNSAGCDSFAILHLQVNGPTARYTLYMDSIRANHWYVLNQCTGAPPLYYIWSWGDGTADSGNATPTHTYTYSGNFNICVSVTDSTGCSSSYCDSTVYIYRLSGVPITLTVIAPTATSTMPVLSNTNSLKIYPNPSSGLFVLSFSQQDIQTKIEVYNILGEKVYDDVINRNQKQYRLNMTSQPSGIYFYRVMSTNGTLISEGKLSIDK